VVWTGSVNVINVACLRRGYEMCLKNWIVEPFGGVGGGARWSFQTYQ